MAHELTFVNGQAQMFSIGATPWHKEGHILTEAPDFGTAIKLAGHDYTVEKRPLYREIQTPEGPVYKPSGEGFEIVRTDSGKVLAPCIGGAYECVQNRDAFEVLRPLIDGGLLRLETGGTLREGADAWLMARWDLTKFGPDAQREFTQAGEEILPFATVCANHSGRRGIIIGETPIRIVCANTLGAAEIDGRSRWETIAHIQGANVKVIEVAERIFHRAVERYETIARHYRLLKECRLSDELFRELVAQVVAPDPRQERDWNPEAKLAECVVERWQRKVGAVTSAWTGGKGHSGEKNAWYAYQGAVEVLDHDKNLFPTRKGCWRTASLMDGQLARMKNTVLDNLLSFAMGA
jgi:phage/plasmid-like protein (TIGR03299 family)